MQCELIKISIKYIILSTNINNCLYNLTDKDLLTYSKPVVFLLPTHDRAKLVCTMLLKVIIVGTVLGTVVSKFDESHSVMNEVFKRAIINVNKCEDTKQWSLVANHNHGFTTSYIGSESVLLSPGSLELYVHVKTSNKAKLLLTLSNSDGVGTASYIYDGLRQESESGWCKLSFMTHYTGLNYVSTCLKLNPLLLVTRIL